MRKDHKSFSFLRLLGALIVAVALSAAALFLVDWLVRRYFEQTAFSTPYYILAGISAVTLFFLFLFPANRPFRRFKDFVRWVLVIAALLVVWGGGAFWNLQGDILYITDKYNQGSQAAAAALPQVEEITLKGPSDVGYHGYFWKNAPGPAGLIIYFGGNGQYAGEATAQMIADPAYAQAYAGYHHLMMDYPGYGLSEGQPGEEAIYRMALAAWDHAAARPDVLPGKIVLIGWSLGTGTASRLAAEKQPAGLVLQAPFYSGAELINGFVGTALMQGPAMTLVRNKYYSYVYAARTQTHALILGAHDDRMIPGTQAELLAARYPAHTLVMLQGGHSAPHNSPQAMQTLQGYLQSILTGAPGAVQ